MPATLRKPRKQHPWYNFDRLLSYGALFNFCAGGRGMGKTYDAKKRSTKKSLKSEAIFVQGEWASPDQFVYLRRYKEELAIAKRTFFADYAHEFPDYDFRVVGWQAQASKKMERVEDEGETAAKKRVKDRRWVVIGFFIALSQAQNVKSGAFHNVTTIIFDEFIAEKGRQYLPSEAETFLGLYSTIDRNQDKTVVLFCANSVSIMNPYFIYWDIRPDQLPEISAHLKDDEGKYGIAVHLPEAAEFKNSVYQTRFGKIIQGTEFGDYAVENQFSDNGENLIALKPSTARHHFNLETKYGTIAIWFDRKSQKYYVQRKLPKDSTLNLTLLTEKMEPGKQLVTFNNQLLSYIRTAFNSGLVFFDKPSTRNAFAEISKR